MRWLIAVGLAFLALSASAAIALVVFFSLRQKPDEAWVEPPEFNP